MTHHEPRDRLALRPDASGPRHYLDGQAVSDGDRLEVRSHGEWVPGLFRWSGRVEFWPRLVPDAADRLAVPAQSVLRRFSSDTPCRWPA
jgi:hypothetical protein